MQAIAAGAGMILTPNTIMPMTALNFLSPDGKCFTFDARANGYGRGEGIGVVILKRLSDALRDNDTIRAVIRGSKVNQDGRTTGKCSVRNVQVFKLNEFQVSRSRAKKLRLLISAHYMNLLGLALTRRLTWSAMGLEHKPVTGENSKQFPRL